MFRALQQTEGASMSSRNNNAPANDDAVQWLDAHRQRFLQGLCQQGYARETLRCYERAIGYFGAVIANRDLDGGQLGPKKITRLRAAVLDSTRPRLRTNTMFCLDRFIDHLVDAGVARRPIPVPQVRTALDRLRAEYEAYLRDQRGLTDATIYHCVSFLKRFMAFRFGERLGNLDDITPHDIVDFLRKLRGGTAALGTRRRRRICATCSASCSGAARRSAISQLRLPRVPQPATEHPAALSEAGGGRKTDRRRPVSRRRSVGATTPCSWCSRASASGRPRSSPSSSTISTGATARS